MSELIIPELEEALQNYKPREWTAEEDAIMEKYYGRVPRDLLLKHLPGREWHQIQNKASREGLTNRWKK